MYKKEKSFITPYRKKRRRKRRRPLALTVFIFSCIIAWLVGAYIVSGTGAFTDYTTMTAPPAQEAPITSLNEEPLNEELFNEEPLNEEPFQTGFRTLSYEQLSNESNGHLLLVNIDYTVPPRISGNLARVSDYVAALAVANKMNEEALVMLRVMFNSAKSAGLTEFLVTQGYRTYEQQQSLYDQAIDKSFVALPGHSEHQTGLAADISYSGVNITNSIQGAWLKDNSYKYGFILRYPKHKTDITGLPYEPWHYRYVGQPHAYFMHKNDLVLEEYISYLQRYGEITVTFEGVVYRVYYLSDRAETVEIPINYSYTASLDNTGGVIVTVAGG